MPERDAECYGRYENASGDSKHASSPIWFRQRRFRGLVNSLNERIEHESAPGHSFDQRAIAVTTSTSKLRYALR
ncbi:MAG: hypothetical protein AAGF61_03230 [Pseudomonadota bacterium]